jgi:hypothetical protein
MATVEMPPMILLGQNGILHCAVLCCATLHFQERGSRFRAVAELWSRKSALLQLGSIANLAGGTASSLEPAREQSDGTSIMNIKMTDLAQIVFWSKCVFESMIVCYRRRKLGYGDTNDSARNSGVENITTAERRTLERNARRKKMATDNPVLFNVHLFVARHVDPGDMLDWRVGLQSPVRTELSRQFLVVFSGTEK